MTKLNWTPKKDALLGTMIDSEIAALLGVSTMTVCNRRRSLGIQAHGGSTASIEWLPEMDTLLGTMSDREIAERLGISDMPVCRRRQALGIDPFQPPIKWTIEMDARLGTMQDSILADILGACTSSIHRRRQEKDIPSWRSLQPTQKGTREERIRGLPDTLTYEQWIYVCEYFDHRCAYCNQETFLTKDHLVPLSKDGPRTALNIIPACWFCNVSKKDKQAHIWIYGKFGPEEGQEIVDRIVAYLMHVQERYREVK